MTRGTNIMLAAVAGAVVAALVANYLSTERGRQFLDSAANSLRELTDQATEFAKNNLSEIIKETTSSIGPVMKEKITAQMKKGSSQTANQH